MPTISLSRSVATESIDVETFQTLVKLTIANGRVKADYANGVRLPSGKEIIEDYASAERVLDGSDQVLEDAVANLYAMFEAYRQADDDKRASDKAAADAEAVRWASLTIDEQRAEVAAKLQTQQDIASAQPLSDPTPSGLAVP